jgi:hypothetical protein
VTPGIVGSAHYHLAAVGANHLTLEAAVAFAEASPFPLPDQAIEDVFAS